MFTSQAILDHIPAALLVIVRVGGLMVFGPLFGSNIIPTRVKAFLAVALGLAAYPLLAESALRDVHLDLNLWTLAPVIATEGLVGLVIGFVANLPLTALTGGGLIMGQQMGLGFGQLFNPAIDDEADVIGQMLFYMAMVGFLMAGGHETLLLTVLHSFQRIPLGGFVPHEDLISLVCGLTLSSLELALRVAAPLLAIVFLESVAMGLLAKTVPQLNILSLGFPLRILVGLAIVAIGLVVINDVATDHIREMFDSLFQWLDSTTPNP
jgi:flagellar biosynthesis protein FliR